MRSIVGSWASSSGAFSLSPAATWPERCASRASSSGNASKIPNVDGPKRSANHRGAPSSVSTMSSALRRNRST